MSFDEWFKEKYGYGQTRQGKANLQYAFTAGEAAGYRRGLERAAEIIRKSCPDCYGEGFTIQADPRTGEPDQCQCQYCYEVTFPLASAIREGIK